MIVFVIVFVTVSILYSIVLNFFKSCNLFVYSNLVELYVWNLKYKLKPSEIPLCTHLLSTLSIHYSFADL